MQKFKNLKLYNKIQQDLNIKTNKNNEEFKYCF